MNREAIYSALFKLISGIDGVETFSRILAHWDDVSPNMQPAMYMTCVSQRAEQVTGFPTKYVLDAKIWLYTHRDTNGEVPSVQINNLLDKLDAVMRPPSNPTFKQTLGGLVEHCWIDGEIATDEGTLGNQSVAIATIRMLVVA
jgi:hypothetical protein